ncbi:ABC transporter [Aneurinibacillus migulanus]|uniref:ABC transporter ATP-binding protein n=1 Tax=Aneurinibacillus migulanus TaxID=47500 RepID=UPI0005BE2279|nr:ABC transporter ATP-binding protein [Aneurinibacillus migulanus]KIV51400.1 ABC transporter [Aneurinibacillus migulanus]KPD09381.1 ABC transporter [Aneurinibacillus migulanus]MCP1358147.1 ABC transporter ATP-binding protein [Aneurinibacillus migulanus]MED4729072.1 ABC transporter ATP-binding protein [Aneurinibacillus migulanus]
MMLTMEDVSFSVLQKPIIRDISLRVSTGQFVGIIGPNGSGKSTLLKTLYRVLQPDEGMIELDKQDLHRLPSRYVFQRMAVVSQETSQTFDFSVEEMVAMGRTPHKRTFESDTDEDRTIVEQALVRVGMKEYAERSFMSLSGGEKQRVLIARALTQQAEVIILDEPTNHLDIRYQLQLLDLLKNLGITVLASLHDLNLASVYCDYLYVMQDGQIVAKGTPEDVLTREVVREVFEVETDIMIHPATGKPHVTFLSERIRTNTEHRFRE